MINGSSGRMDGQRRPKGCQSDACLYRQPQCAFIAHCLVRIIAWLAMLVVLWAESSWQTRIAVALYLSFVFVSAVRGRTSVTFAYNIIM